MGFRIIFKIHFYIYGGGEPLINISSITYPEFILFPVLWWLAAYTWSYVLVIDFVQDVGTDTETNA